MQRTTIITAAIFAGALATAPWSASAGPLDYQGLAFQSQGSGANSVLAGVETGNGDAVPVFASTSSSSFSERPIYRRRPYRDLVHEYSSERWMVWQRLAPPALFC